MTNENQVENQTKNRRKRLRTVYPNQHRINFSHELICGFCNRDNLPGKDRQYSTYELERHEKTSHRTLVRNTESTSTLLTFTESGSSSNSVNINVRDGYNNDLTSQSRSRDDIQEDNIFDSDTEELLFEENDPESELLDSGGQQIPMLERTVSITDMIATDFAQMECDDESENNLALENEETWQRFKDAYPFADIPTLVMHALVYSGDKLFSQADITKFLYVAKILLDLQKEAVEKGSEIKLPALSNIFNFQHNKGNKIPSFKTSEVPVNIGTEREPEIKSGYINMPSDHLRILMSTNSQRLHGLPDRTRNTSKGLKSGTKWRTNQYIQAPMVTHNSIDYWVGDIVECIEDRLYLVQSFYTCNDRTVADVYEVRKSVSDNETWHAFSTTRTTRPVDDFKAVYPIVDSNTFDRFFSIVPPSEGIEGQFVPFSDIHRNLVYKEFPLKKEYIDRQGEKHFYKVKITPITLFLDDTSGNISKNYNKYESWSMRCAALPFSERVKRENTHFLATVRGADGLGGCSLIPGLTKDLKALENGMIMYSREHNEKVIVSTPLLLIEADNNCHNQLCGIMALSSLYPCRKCYYHKLVLKHKNRSNLKIDDYLRVHNSRTRAHYVAASSCPDRANVINGALKENEVIVSDELETTPPRQPARPVQTTAKDLRFKDTGSDALLDLQAYDPSEDTPVEVLHTVLLGVAKYLLLDLVKRRMKGIPGQVRMRKLHRLLKVYESTKGFSRTFRRKMNHVGSFVGRDFKQLIQVLPIILVNDFSDDAAIIPIIPSFVSLGKLCSLLFVKEINDHFNEYVKDIRDTVEELTKALYELDNNSAYSCSIIDKPKIHLLWHIPEDLERFGCVLHYESETGEQFNRFIREHLFHTNRRDTMLHVALRFGKQSILRSIIDGGSWIDKNNKRVERGSDVIEFLNLKKDIFMDIMFGAREFQDNNDLTVTSSIPTNTVFVFSKKSMANVHNRSLYIGQAISLPGTNGTVVKLFNFEGKDTNMNLMMSEVDTSPALSFGDVNVETIIDMHYQNSQGQYIVNINKFNMYWYFKYNTIKNYP